MTNRHCSFAASGSTGRADPETFHIPGALAVAPQTPLASNRAHRRS